MIDTLKTTGIGSGGLLVQFLDVVPELVKLGVGVLTIIYLGLKIYKEYKK